MKHVGAQIREFPGLRRIAHWLLAVVLYYSGLLHLFSFVRRRVLRRREIVVVGLHRVLTPQQAAHTLSEPAIILLLPTFKRLLRALGKHYRVLGLSEFGFAAKDLACPLCLITFDDGWRDTFENACPELQKLRLPAALFVATGLIGSSELFWVERFTRVWEQNSQAREKLLMELHAVVPFAFICDLSGAIAALKEIPAATRDKFIRSAESRFPSLGEPDAVDRFMTWEQVTASAEILEIASHTVSHPLLTHEQGEDVARELAVSKRQLELRLKCRVSAFAYPNGNFDSRMQQAVAEAGYAFAFTTQAGVYHYGDDRLAVPRILLHEGNVTGLTGRFSSAMLHLRLTGWSLR
jgi:peptidoglycan/xylan/chitin deacetylase (PgdA/CDA1 family)